MVGRPPWRQCRECGEPVSRLRNIEYCGQCTKAIADREMFGNIAPLAGRRAFRAVKVLCAPQEFETEAHYLNELGNMLVPVAELYRLEVPDWPAVTFNGAGR